MSLSTVLAEAEQRRKSLVVYAREETDIADRFGTRNAVVEHRPLPSSAEEGFVLIRDGEEFRGALSLSLL